LASASALYDLASASILISTKAGLVHFMANSLFSAARQSGGLEWAGLRHQMAGIHQLANNGKPARRLL
jgi:hypothetical protein